jgi:hypothetical protein
LTQTANGAVGADSDTFDDAIDIISKAKFNSLLTNKANRPG